MLRPRLFAFIILILGLAAGWIFVNRVEIKQNIQDWQSRRNLPPAVVLSPTVKSSNHLTIFDKFDKKDIKEIEEITEIDNGIASVPRLGGVSRNDASELPAEINLAVPFAAQAPYAIWDQMHEEACEEAALIMLDAFCKGIQKISKEEAELAIQNLVKWEKENLGFFEDTTAEENVRILKEYFGLSGARAVFDISVEDIKKELAVGRPVLVPTAGKMLPNPYFRNGGPIYHMILIKGYTQDGLFITNDPGTKRGADFTYKFEEIYKAIHDWNGGDVVNGRKVMIVVDG